MGSTAKITGDGNTILWYLVTSSVTRRRVSGVVVSWNLNIIHVLIRVKISCRNESHIEIQSKSRVEIGDCVYNIVYL